MTWSRACNTLKIGEYWRLKNEKLNKSLIREGRCVVVIPLYRLPLTVDETFSLVRCRQHLDRWPVYLIVPQTLQLSADMLDLCRDLRLSVERFDDAYFDGIGGYNRLLTTAPLFVSFRRFEYILIHQLDCLVFDDQLERWCAKRFDYIGAPWTDGVDDIRAVAARASLIGRIAARLGSRPRGVIGNGGFSLRRVSAALLALRLLKYVRKDRANEDLFWSFVVPAYLPFFKVPSAAEALGFSFEGQPRRLFAENGNSLPFGCHKWRHFDPEFWRSILDREIASTGSGLT